jgi:hypothetical protein
MNHGSRCRESGRRKRRSNIVRAIISVVVGGSGSSFRGRESIRSLRVWRVGRYLFPGSVG